MVANRKQQLGRRRCLGVSLAIFINQLVQHTRGKCWQTFNLCFLVLWKAKGEVNFPIVWTSWQTAVKTQWALAPWNHSLPWIFPVPTLIRLQPTQLVPRGLFLFHIPLSAMIQQHLISCLKCHILCHEQMPIFTFH